MKKQIANLYRDFFKDNMGFNLKAYYSLDKDIIYICADDGEFAYKLYFTEYCR